MISPLLRQGGFFSEATRMGLSAEFSSRLLGAVMQTGSVVLETDKRPDGEKARVKEWLLASRKDGNQHA